MAKKNLKQISETKSEKQESCNKNEKCRRKEPLNDGFKVVVIKTTFGNKKTCEINVSICELSAISNDSVNPKQCLRPLSH